jgi:hypothetical protein
LLLLLPLTETANIVLGVVLLCCCDFFVVAAVDGVDISCGLWHGVDS